ncbi:MAG: hypothetical protein HYV46_14505 [candidate division NC10 bacterium]|nr:hypothetical protein [candidate division NC10 bacterium]
MDDKAFQELWEKVSDGMRHGAGQVLEAFFPKIRDSVRALNASNVYWLHDQPQDLRTSTRVFICSPSGLGKMRIELKSTEKEDPTWSHKLSLIVTPWDDVAEVKLEVLKDETEEERFVGMALRLRDGDGITLLPERNSLGHGGVRIIDGKSEQYDEPQQFTASVLEALGRR